jgi:hypothetical protein
MEVDLGVEPDPCPKEAEDADIMKQRHDGFQQLFGMKLNY